jgi:hypothetical protein
MSSSKKFDLAASVYLSKAQSHILYLCIQFTLLIHTGKGRKRERKRGNSLQNWVEKIPT